MITQERVLKTLSKFNVTEDELLEWEKELGLDIPTDRFGNKHYSQLHVNLFKNVKKHLAIGRSLNEIKRMIILPVEYQSPKANAGMSKPLTLRKEQAELDADDPNDADYDEQQEMVEMLYPDAPQAPDAEDDDVDVSLDGPEPAETVAYDEPQIYHPPQPEIQQEVVDQQQQAMAQHASEIHTTFENTLSNRLLRQLQPALARSTQPLAAAPGQAPLSVVDGDQSLTLPRRRLKRYATPPANFISSASFAQPGPNAGLLALIERLMAEKDEIQDQLTRTEKQNTHLYQANEMFQRKLKELAEELAITKAKSLGEDKLKLIDEKARLQKQIITAEHRQAEAEKRLTKAAEELKFLRSSMANRVNPAIFVGNWLEESDLVGVAFDNFGINIESKRNRMFRITQQPERFFGQTAIIENTYDYQNNALWKRTETLVLNIISENRLEGELIAEYTLDGTPVAKANYRVKCYRNGVRS